MTSWLVGLGVFIAGRNELGARLATVMISCIAIFVVYQNVENHVIQPLIVGRAVKLSPPATMVAALVGVSAGGVVGALIAVPVLGASKAVYIAAREGRFR